MFRVGGIYYSVLGTWPVDVSAGGTMKIFIKWCGAMLCVRLGFMILRIVMYGMWTNRESRFCTIMFLVLVYQSNTGNIKGLKFRNVQYQKYFLCSNFNVLKYGQSPQIRFLIV